MPFVEFLAFHLDELLKIFEWSSLSGKEKRATLIAWAVVLSVAGIAIYLVVGRDAVAG